MNLNDYSFCSRQSNLSTTVAERGTQTEIRLLGFALLYYKTIDVFWG
jgi:hypothetical protein